MIRMIQIIFVFIDEQNVFVDNGLRRNPVPYFLYLKIFFFLKEKRKRDKL